MTNTRTTDNTNPRNNQNVFDTSIPYDLFNPDCWPDGWREALKQKWPNAERLTTAIRLAKDLDTCEALLLGHPVDRDRIDQAELKRALEPRLVQLARPIDQLAAA